ncbi:type I glutamate--ammonia ligase [Mariprofundus ferrooxydans]|uniref:type I glutamate--ammonia ligase n=1 Tax=Mariprofundus ferrooxydans TaxID=314344 RepID=UPI0014305D1E|nr:type I glutamate--ammonia ligase [Mariprofundus ferrooxydans]
MSDAIQKVFDLIKENECEFVDVRFTDTRGKWQHVTYPIHQLSEDSFEDGFAFDGSSVAGWCDINNSDMALIPDPTSANIDPFYEASTLVLVAQVIDPITGQDYNRCPRQVAQRALSYIRSAGIADTAYFGPELEFFIFDGVRFSNEMGSCGYQIESEEAAWNSNKNFADSSEGMMRNSGHRPRVKGGYFPVPPVDSLHEIRSDMMLVMADLGIHMEAHHHEVATAGQCELAMKFAELIQKADEVQWYKYVIHNVAHAHGKTATFMPKPIYGDNGTAMHVHQSLWLNGKNLFAGDKYANLSQEALWYIGGIIKHAKALNAMTNASTNSYKRLVPGFEAPVMLAYSNRNRSASIRIPVVSSDPARRIEVRFPDCTANPYLAFTAMMLAGLDGVANKIDPGEAADKNLYDLPPEEGKKIPTVCGSLEEALKALDADRDFLKVGGIMDDDMIDAYIELKMEELNEVRMRPHPKEFELYYSC